jgi:L-asparaginase
MSTNAPAKLVVLGTGGTIAGLASGQFDNVGYTAAKVGVAELMAAVPALNQVLTRHVLVTEQVAQIDSKDMTWAVWQALRLRVNFHLAQHDVAAVVITHGTDTLEETAYFLHRTLASSLLRAKPVVLTCAMRPASSVTPDGPQNLLDAAAVALSGTARGVSVVCAGTVHDALQVQKVSTYKLDAFDSGDSGPLAYVEEGALRQLRDWPEVILNEDYIATQGLASVDQWPRVEIVLNYAGVGATMVDALLAQDAARLPGVSPLRGLVIAGTGNGTIHESMQATLARARARGIVVVRASRCVRGRVLPMGDDVFPDSQGLSAVKARIALMLRLMA